MATSDVARAGTTFVCKRLFEWQVLIFIRWARWLLQHALRLQEVVIVNFDETKITNVTSWSHGIRIRKMSASSVTSCIPASMPQLAKGSLLAAICNRAELQAELPQIILTRRGQRVRSEAGADELQELGDAHWQNATGSMTTQSLKKWVTLLRRKLHACNAWLWVVLVLDCDPTHLTLSFLKHCVMVGVIPLIIPAKCTWFLQGLDVYTFAVLKRFLSGALHRARLQAGAGGLTAAECMTVTRNVCKSVMSDRSWVHALDRCGLGKDLSNCRHPLQRLLQGQDLKARPPTADELCQLTGRPMRKKHEALEMLVKWPETLRSFGQQRLPPCWRIGMPSASVGPASHLSQEETAVSAAPDSPRRRVVSLSARSRLGPVVGQRTAGGLTSDAARGPVFATRSRRPQLLSGVTDSQTRS